MAWNDELKKSRSTSGQTLEGLEFNLHVFVFFLGKFQDEEMNKCVTNKNRKGGILMVDPTALKNLQITFDGSKIRRENHLTCIRNPAN